MSASEARAVRLVGAAIAALSGPVVVGSLVLHWFTQTGFCGFPACSQATVTGWTGLGIGRVLLITVAVAGIVPLLAESMSAWARPGLRLATAVLALTGALLVVFRVVVGPVGAIPLGPIPGGAPGSSLAIPAPGTELRAGPFIALVACCGVAGGALLAGVGHRFFARAPAAVAATAVIWAACGLVVVSLWLPWVRATALPVPVDSPAGLGGTGGMSAWHALGTLSVLLVLGSLAIAGGGLIAIVFRWRGVFLALGVAGWLLAAGAVVATPFPANIAGSLPSARPAIAYEPGYYVALAASAAILLAGASAAFGGGEGRVPVSAAR